MLINSIVTTDMFRPNMWPSSGQQEREYSQLPPWRWPHKWPKHVGGHNIFYNYNINHCHIKKNLIFISINMTCFSADTLSPSCVLQNKKPISSEMIEIVPAYHLHRIILW